MVGCVIDSGKNVIVEEQKTPQPPEPVPIEAPTQIVVEEPAPPVVDEVVVELPQTPPQELPVEQPSVAHLLARESAAQKEAWLEGVVIDIVTSRPGYAVGTIRDSETYRRYEFMTDQQLQRWQEVRFKVNQYDDVLEISILDADNNGTPDIQVRTRGGTSLKRWEDGLRVMEGRTEMVRHARDGKTYGVVRIQDGGFRQYKFVTDLYFSNGEQVEIKLDQEDQVIEISRM